MARQGRRWWTGAGLALSAWAGGRAALAQDAATLAARRGLIEEAQHARGTGDHTAALSLAERAGRLSMTPSLRLFIAQEQYSLGRVAEAYGNAATCRREAEGEAALRNSSQVASTCRALEQELSRRIGRVVVAVPTPAPPGLRVVISGAPLGDEFWGAPYVVTPGSLAVEATAPGYSSFHQDVSVTAGATVTVRLAMPAEVVPEDDGPAPQSSPPPSTASPARGADEATPASGPEGRAGGGIPSGTIVLGGVGVASLVASVVFFVLSGTAQGECPQSVCPDESTRQRVLANVSTDLAVGYTTLAVGVIALAGGAVWYALERPHAGGAAADAGARRRGTHGAYFGAAPVPGGAVVGAGMRF